jgi:hypothetical protein
VTAKGSAPTAEFWVCDRCKSLNQRWAKRCYGCQAERRIDHQILSSDGPSAVWTAEPGALATSRASGPVAVGRYRSSTLRAAFAVVFIGLTTSLGLALLGVTVAALVGVGRQGWTDYLAVLFAEDNRRILLTVVGLLIVAYLGAAISWFAWLSRAIDNVPALGGGRPPTSPRGAIAAWFVPVMNLAKPYWILRDLHDRLAVPGRRNAPLRAWWICWLPTGINMTLMGAGLVLWLLYLGWVVIPLLLFPLYAIDPVVGLVATAALAWALAGLFVRGRGVRMIVLSGLVVAGTIALGIGIQVAIQRALEHGTSLTDILATVQQVSLVVSLIGSSAWILAGLFAISIVIEIERRQHARARLGTGHATGPAT